MTPETLSLGGWRFRIWGEDTARPLLLLHGFAGHGGFWARLAPSLVAAGFRVVAPDLPGHGASAAPDSPETYHLPEAADTLAGHLTAIAGSTPWCVAGYSLGGRLALHLAVRHPHRMQALTLVGASAGLESAEARSERRTHDAEWAQKLRTQGLESFLTEWEAQPLFATQAALPEAGKAWLAESRQGHDADGLARAMEAFGLGAQPPLHDHLSTLAVPTLWVAGEADAKFSALAHDLATRMPDARAVIVPGCGHHVPLERPEAFLALVLGHSAPQLEGEPV